jgi:hypothetical protein
MYIFIKVYILRQIYLYGFYISEINNLKVNWIYILNILTQILFRTTLFTNLERIWSMG